MATKFYALQEFLKFLVNMEERVMHGKVESTLELT